MIARFRHWLIARRRTGPRGERVAARYLRHHGYRILTRNLRNRYGEIDLIAQPRDDRGVLVFVEVKAGHTGAAFVPEVRVTPLKQRKITALSAQVLRSRRLTVRRVRYDVIAVEFASSASRVAPVIRHHVGAFESHV